jgi:hypoxanthine phosphoribosyltransferase
MKLTRYHVVTLSEAALRTSAIQLLQIAEEAGFPPDVIIGIRTGGYVVAECMKPALKNAIAVLPITCRRPGTGRKSKPGVRAILRHLPYFLADRLRVAEHLYRNVWHIASSATQFVPDRAEMDAITAHLPTLGPAPRILIVDDAVDSGVTLAAIENFIRGLAPSATVKSASITVTTATPLRNPDFSLYRYALCRFPWSFDFKPNRAGADL